MAFEIRAASDRAALRDLMRGGWHPPAEIAQRVAEILADVRARGDAALVDYARRFDDPGFGVDALRVEIPAPDAAALLVPHEIVRGLQIARERVERYHRRQVHEDVEYGEDDGTRYAFRQEPLDAIAAYVPAGTAPLPSSVIMNVVPAKIAGVRRIAVFTPPQRGAGISPAILYACALCGVDEVYAAGGAQAIGAAAYGTESIRRVDKIVGPGNVWVTEAKRQVFGACAIDGLAGPSEVLVIADERADPQLVAAELLAQAEHDPMARVAAVSQSRELLERCARLLERAAGEASERSEIVAAVMQRGTHLIHARSREEIFDVTSAFAPEHLSLQVEDPQAYLPHIRRAGAVFVGAHTPVACGDYLAGTNHVLPTSGAARFSSGLRTADFLRTYSVVENSPQRMRADAPVIEALARFEGLEQHARSAAIRAGEAP